MTRPVLLVRYGEVHLKGLNRPYFLKKLVDNVRRAVQPLEGTVWMSDSRIYVAGRRDIAEYAERVRKVFGVHSVSLAVETDKDLALISQTAAEMMREKAGTFKVLARRSDKHFPLNSMELQAELGGVVLDSNPNLKVDVHNPQIYLNVEIREKATLCVDDIPAVGGMPMGTGGKALLLLSGGIDSPVAGFQLMRRGVQVQAVHFYSFPYTSERARQKVLDLAAILGEYGTGLITHIVPFTEIQLAIHEKCPEALGTLLMRRQMMRIADAIAKNVGAQALITGESLGQVASQTMEALACTDAVATMPVFRPLIGLDKLEITNMAEKIGTYQTSILPYEDCCTVFTPRHPTTKPKMADVERAERNLDAGEMIERAIAQVETVKSWETGDAEA